MSRPILRGIVCNHTKVVSRLINSGRLTHREVPYSADREYLKGQNPAEGKEIGGLGAMKEAVYACPDSSNEQRDILVIGLLVMSIREHNHVLGAHGEETTYFLRTGARHASKTT